MPGKTLYCLGEAWLELQALAESGMNHPSVTYYENSKKNAVATKITDTASSTLQQTINTEFINVAAQTALSGLESITQKDSSISGKLIDDMKTIQDNLSGYADTIATFQNGNASLSENLESMSALIPELQDILENSRLIKHAGRLEIFMYRGTQERQRITHKG